MASSQLKLASFATVSALLGNVQAFWRLNCANIQYGRIDPLVNPGGVAAHVHTAQGGSSKSERVDRERSRLTKC
jgi:hypothetical protein